MESMRAEIKTVEVAAVNTLSVPLSLFWQQAENYISISSLIALQKYFQ